MQMFVLVLNREEFLEPLLEEMLKQNIGGATILESTGMMRVLDGDHNIDDLPVLGVLRRHEKSPFWGPVSRRADVRLLPLTVENRAEIPAELTRLLG